MTQSDKDLHDFPISRSWQRARWIRAADERKPDNAFFLFRKQFTRESGALDVLKVFVSAEDRYMLWLNGRLIGRGLPPSDPDFKYYDELEVPSGLLAAGENCLAALVYAGHETYGLLLEAVDSVGEVVVASDASWRGCRAAAWDANTLRVNGRVAQEFFDARRLPADWQASTFADSVWDACREAGPVMWGRRSKLRSPANRLIPREIPFPRETPQYPYAVTYTEECLDIVNRRRPDDLAPTLSAVGSEIEHARAENVASLLSDAGDAIFACSTAHQADPAFDGIYDPCVVLDFGKVLTGYLELELEGTAGGVIEIGYVERLLNGKFNNAIEVSYADRLTMRDGQQTFRSFFWKSFRYVKLRFRNCRRPVTVRACRAISSTYPFEEKGAFRSDDTLLNQVFEICRYTIPLCCHDFIMDTPWREQNQWTGDTAAVILPGIYACFGDTKLAAKFLRQSGSSQLPLGLIPNHTHTGPPPNSDRMIRDYSLWWIYGLWQHYRYTGELRWIHEFFPHVVRIMQYNLHFVNDHGLIEDIPTIFIDHVTLNKRGENAAYNGLLYGTLDIVAQMARLKGDSYWQEKAETWRAMIRANFQDRLLVRDCGCIGQTRHNGVLDASICEHANAAALLWDLVAPEIAESIIKGLFEEKTVSYIEATPFACSVTLRALAHVGRLDLALELIRERWGKRMVEKGASSTYEEWNMSGSRRGARGAYYGLFRSLSHAWSAVPAEFLIRNLIGCEILESGCSKVGLAPVETEFDYQVTFPTPRGPIVVKNTGGTIDIQAPAGVEVVQKAALANVQPVS